MTRLALALAVLLVTPALAQAPTFALSFSPSKANRATTGTLSARDLPPEPQGAAPVDVLALALQRGFKTDAKGAPGRCGSAELSEMRCPATARIGTGSATLAASFLGGAQDYTASLEVFVVSRDRVALQVDEPETGTRASVPGRLVAAGRLGGPELRFEGLAQAVPAPPPGFTVRLKSFEMKVGRRRTVVRRVKRRRVKKVYAIVRTPRSCSGSWAATLALTRTDGSETAQPLTAPCSR